MKVYVTTVQPITEYNQMDGETIVLEDDTSYQLVCCDCVLTHELGVRRLSPGHRTLIKIRRISESRIAELEAANAKYKSALGHIGSDKEYGECDLDYDGKVCNCKGCEDTRIAKKALRED